MLGLLEKRTRWFGSLFLVPEPKTWARSAWRFYTWNIDFDPEFLNMKRIREWFTVKELWILRSECLKKKLPDSCRGICMLAYVCRFLNFKKKFEAEFVLLKAPWILLLKLCMGHSVYSVCCSSLYLPLSFLYCRLAAYLLTL